MDLATLPGITTTSWGACEKENIVNLSFLTVLVVAAEVPCCLLLWSLMREVILKIASFLALLVALEAIATVVVVAVEV